MSWTRLPKTSRALEPMPFWGYDGKGEPSWKIHFWHGTMQALLPIWDSSRHQTCGPSIGEDPHSRNGLIYWRSEWLSGSAICKAFCFSTVQSPLGSTSNGYSCFCSFSTSGPRLHYHHRFCINGARSTNGWGMTLLLMMTAMLLLGFFFSSRLLMWSLRFSIGLVQRA